MVIFIMLRLAGQVYIFGDNYCGCKERDLFHQYHCIALGIKIHLPRY